MRMRGIESVLRFETKLGSCVDNPLDNHMVGGDVTKQTCVTEYYTVLNSGTEGSRLGEFRD
jgi:hypothetical protein